MADAADERSQLLYDGCRHRDAQLLRGHLGNHIVLAAVACELAARLLLEMPHQRIHLHPCTNLWDMDPCLLMPAGSVWKHLTASYRDCEGSVSDLQTQEDRATHHAAHARGVAMSLLLHAAWQMI